jgi:hypothetical protein
MAEDVTANRQETSAPDTGRIYSVGCLPIILAWFLLDLIGKAIIWGVASLCGMQIPPLPKAVQAMALGLLTPLGIICIATIGFWLYLIVSDFLSNIFGKGKRNKENDNERNGN